MEKWAILRPTYRVRNFCWGVRINTPNRNSLRARTQRARDVDAIKRQWRNKRDTRGPAPFVCVCVSCVSCQRTLKHTQTQRHTFIHNIVSEKCAFAQHASERIQSTVGTLFACACAFLRAAARLPKANKYIKLGHVLRIVLSVLGTLQLWALCAAQFRPSVLRCRCCCRCPVDVRTDTQNTCMLMLLTPCGSNSAWYAHMVLCVCVCEFLNGKLTELNIWDTVYSGEMFVFALLACENVYDRQIAKRNGCESYAHFPTLKVCLVAGV